MLSDLPAVLTLSPGDNLCKEMARRLAREELRQVGGRDEEEEEEEGGGESLRGERRREERRDG